MNFQFYLEKLFDSREFQNFIKENRTAFLCSGFFTIDFEGKDNQQHLDYWNPFVKKLYSFKLNENPIVMINTEVQEGFIPERINDNIEFDIDKIAGLIKREMEERKINNSIQKIIFSLQSNHGQSYLLGTVFLSGLGLIKVIFDISESRITEFEKKSFFDMMKFAGKK